ncbi:hypothetical protein JCM15519_34680 [Fundidesulfovibrio butyratiphilus]
MRTLVPACLFVLLLAACTPTPRPSTPPATRVTFEQVDVNKDGKVSLEEILTVTKNPDRSAVERHFKARNWKGDGYLDRDQFDAWREVEFDGDM